MPWILITYFNVFFIIVQFQKKFNINNFYINYWAWKCFIMIYTIEEIKNTAIPIVEEYGVVRLSIFGSYARGEANDDSDLDFLIDKGNLRGLIQYYSLVQKLEDAFNCHVDLITMGVSNRDFLKRIQKEELVIYER